MTSRKRGIAVMGILCCVFFSSYNFVKGDGVSHLPGLRLETSGNLTSVYPNPFNDHTTIFYAAKRNEFVKIRLYNSKGILMGELFDDVVEQGATYQFELDGSSLSPGVYYYTIETKTKVHHQRIERIR